MIHTISHQHPNEDPPPYEDYYRLGSDLEPSAQFHTQLPILPKTRPRTPFEEKYPAYADYFKRLKTDQSISKIIHPNQPMYYDQNIAPAKTINTNPPFSKSPGYMRKRARNSDSSATSFNISPAAPSFNSLQNQRKRNNNSASTAASLLSPDNVSTSLRDAQRSLSSPSEGRTQEDLRRMESVLNVVSFTKDDTEAQKILSDGRDRRRRSSRISSTANQRQPRDKTSEREGDIVTASVNGIEALWDRSQDKLIVKDRIGLEKNILVENGVPFVLVEYMTDEGPHTQKMIVNDCIGR